MRMKKDTVPVCPVDATISIMGGKYKAVILWNLKEQTLRYSEIHRIIPAATDKMLTQQLREMERDGIIARAVYPVVPPRTEYSLTALGKTLMPIIEAMCNWGNEYMVGAWNQPTEEGKKEPVCAGGK